MIESTFEARPWGSFRVLFDGLYCKIKILEINPAQSTSLQSHKLRDEHWYVVNGHPTLLIEDKIYHGRPEDSYDVKRTVKHRISNNSNLERVIIVEVQTGMYFGEDDIVRYDDIYGRK